MSSADAGDDVLLTPEPFRSSVMQIEPQWIDYNGHLNMAYYNVMFDRAIDELWFQLGIGPGYMKERHGSTFTAECHVRYLREIHLGDPVQVSILLAKDRAVSAGYPGAHPGLGARPLGHSASRGHRPKRGDALEKLTTLTASSTLMVRRREYAVSG